MSSRSIRPSSERLDRHGEQLWGEQLRAAKRAFASIVDDLPSSERAYALGGEYRPVPDAEPWPHERIESAYARLLDLAGEGAAPGLARNVDRAKDEKRRIDEARETLILANMAFVTHIARRYPSSRVPFADLVQEGTIDLMIAVDRFEPERGHRFSSFACWWIRREILNAIDDTARTIRLPGSVRNDLRRMHQTREALRAELGRPPTSAEITVKVGWPTKKVRRLIAARSDSVFLDDLAPEGEGLERLRCLTDWKVPTPLESVTVLDLRRKLDGILAVLTPREREIIRLRFGLNGGTDHTLDAIAKRVCLSRERVRQIVASALKRMHQETMPPAVARAALA